MRRYGKPSLLFSDIPKYANYVRGHEGFGLDTYDLILDDGRARVAVAYQAFHYMNENSTLMIHDYPEDGKLFGRLRYRNVEEYFEKIDAAGRLSVFRKRPGLTIPEEVFESELLEWA